MTTFEDIFSMVAEDERKLGQYASATIPIHVFIAKGYEQGKKDGIKEEREVLKQLFQLWRESEGRIDEYNLLNELMKQ